MIPPENPVAVVTGASSGIGAAVALRLVSSGVRVAVMARRRDRLEELAAKADAQMLLLPVDLRDEEAVLEAFRQVRERWGGVDILINSAGLGRDAPLLSGETAAWREMLEVNVVALSICTREAIRSMRERNDRGHVIHISSITAHRVSAGASVYTASKAAVRSLTESLRLELHEAGSAIRVSSISPGFVDTEFTDNYHARAYSTRGEHDLFPMLQPEDIADAVIYVLSQPEHVQVHDILVRPTDQHT